MIGKERRNNNIESKYEGYQKDIAVAEPFDIMLQLDFGAGWTRSINMCRKQSSIAKLMSGSTRY